MKWYGFVRKFSRIGKKGRRKPSVKLAAAVVSAAAAVGSICAGGYVAYGYETLPREIEAARIIEVAQEEPEPDVEEPVAEEPEEAPEETREEEPRELSLVGTSIEKDLKVKVQDQESKLVTGVPFKITVKPEKKSTVSEYEDKDQDGILYISKIDPGKYTVELQETEGYTLKESSVTVEVKDKIEYKKVDVAAEIKKESQVNTAAEDTAVNNVPEENTLKDTVPLIESRVITSKVEKSDVSAPKFPEASSSGEKSVTLTKTAVSLPEEGAGEDVPDEGGTGEDESGAGEPGMEEEPEAESVAAASAWRSRTAAGGTGFLLAAAPAAAGTVSETSVRVSLPETVVLYPSAGAASGSFRLVLALSGDPSVIKAVQWSSSDESVAALSEKKTDSVTVSAKAKGAAEVAAEITYEKDSMGAVAKETLKCRVSAEEPANASETLKDKSGNVLYLDDKAQTEATVRDYAAQEVFYTAPRYTGWQTIGGKVYYYNEEYQAVTGDQVIGGVSYHFAADGSLAQSSGNKGIDVSKYQGNIDWGAVAASGINFAIIRVGYRGSSTGVLVEDPYFRRNISGASKAGIKVGVYFFTQAVTEAEAVEEASMAMSLVSGYHLAYPIFIDTESASNGRANGLGQSSRTAIVKAFCQTVRNGGYKAGVYASKSWFRDQLNASALNSYCIWVAQYSGSCTYSGRYDLWQHTSKGKVSGITGNVDMNISYVGY